MLYELIALILRKHTVHFVLHVMSEEVKKEAREHSDDRIGRWKEDTADVLQEAARRIEQLDSEVFSPTHIEPV